jgi:tetratricopeptide (TPR) repeat protein
MDEPPLTIMRLISIALVTFCSLISSHAEIPSGVPEKASEATQFALRWSIDRILVRIELKVETDPSGKIWRNKTTYRFAFYSPSKQEAMWSDEAGNMESSAFAIPAGWSTEPIPRDFDDLPEALKKSGSKDVSDIASATLYYQNGKPLWLLELANGIRVGLHPGESVESELQEGTLDTCNSLYNQKKFNQAFECLKNLAEKGLALAQFNLAVMYVRGEGVKKSTTEAEKWLKRAADQGYPGAEDVLLKLQMLDVINANKLLDNLQKEGPSYFDRAEESYKKGDYPNAFKLYEEAEFRGVVQATYKLGLLYYNGQGTKKDMAKGMELIRNAAKLGCADAKKFLETH